jgi:hypothetical protein
MGLPLSRLPGRGCGRALPAWFYRRDGSVPDFARSAPAKCAHCAQGAELLRFGT